MLHVNGALIDIRNAVYRKDIYENENSDKLINIVEEILDFNKQQKGKGLIILIPKLMLAIGLAQVQVGNTSENLLNEIFQIIYALCQAKEITKKVYNNIMKIWNENFELLYESYSASDIQDYFGYIIKKHQTVTDNPPIRIYRNRKENRITFKIKRGYYLELVTPVVMKLLGSTKSKIVKNKNGLNVPHIQIPEVV